MHVNKTRGWHFSHFLHLLWFHSCHLFWYKSRLLAVNNTRLVFFVFCCCCNRTCSLVLGTNIGVPWWTLRRVCSVKTCECTHIYLSSIAMQLDVCRLICRFVSVKWTPLWCPFSWFRSVHCTQIQSILKTAGTWYLRRRLAFVLLSHSVDVVTFSFIISLNSHIKCWIVKTSHSTAHRCSCQIMHSDILNPSIDSGNSSFGLLLLLLPT